jgi:hypothetical protein
MEDEQGLVLAEDSDDLLIRVAEADQATRPDRQSFLVARGMGMRGVHVQHPGLPAGFCARVYADIEDLIEAGYLRPRYGPHGGSGFDITLEGIDHARLLKAASSNDTQDATSQSAGHPLEWEDRVLPVLETIGRVYHTSHPELGLSIETLANEVGVAAEDEQLGRVVYELVQTGYLEAPIDTDQTLAPRFFRLTERGLQVVAGWPTEAGADLLARLLTLVDQRIASASSDEERSKWQRLRDGVVGVGRDVGADVLSALATGAIRAGM